MILMTAENMVGMSDDLIGAIITAVVTSVISIIGFIVTNLSMRKSFKNELMVQRDGIALEKMATMPFEILDLMDKMIQFSDTEKEKVELENFKRMMNEIYSYGSEKAISLVSLMQKENYAANGDIERMDKFRMMSFYVLLATQIKFDVTGVYVNPDFWFNMRITDYATHKEEIKKANNKLVKELNLSDKMKID